MKKILVVFMMIVGLLIPALSFADLSPSTPIAPVAPALTPAPAPIPTPAPLAPIVFKDWWIGMSLDAGLPYTGEISKMDVATRNSGGTAFTADAILNFDVGYTPFQISKEVGFGFMARMSLGLSYTDLGTYSAGMNYFDNYGNYLGSTYYQDSFYGLATWIGLTPMLTARFQMGRNDYLNLGIGASYYSYTSCGEYDTNGNVSQDIPINGPAWYGWTPAFLIQMGIGNGATIELGLTGPDIHVGFGFAL